MTAGAAYPASPSLVVPADVIPWTSASPSPSPQGSGAPAPPLPGTCVDSMLAAVLDGVENLKTGQILVTLRFSNTTSTACVLAHRPTISILLRDGRTLALPQADLNDPPVGDGAVMTAALQVPERGQTAAPSQATLDFSAYFCTSGSGSPGVQGIRVALPENAGTLIVPAGGQQILSTEPCLTDPTVHDGVLVGEFQPATPATAATLTQLKAEIVAPASVRAGQRLQYSVRLTNVSRRQYRFDPCPSYYENLKSVQTQAESYQLNCASLGVLAPGASATFAMVIQVPAAMEPGSVGLVWALTGPPSSAISALAFVTVTP